MSPGTARTTASCTIFRSYTVLHCPSDPDRGGSTETQFVAVVGPGTMFPSDGTSRRLADVTDGPENTLIVVEVVNAGIHWMEPKELDWGTMSFRLNDRTYPSVSSNHPFRGSRYPGPHVLTVNDMVTNLPRNLHPETLRALLTIAGGERINRREWHPRP